MAIDETRKLGAVNEKTRRTVWPKNSSKRRGIQVIHHVTRSMSRIASRFTIEMDAPLLSN